MNTRLLIAIIAGAALLAVGLWYWRESNDESGLGKESIGGVVQDSSERRVLYWYDPMAPLQRFNGPGKSPFMDMELVPKYAGEVDEPGVQIAPGVQQNLGIRVAQVERASFGDSMVTVARIEVNETQLHALASRVSGYAERLHVRAVGDQVSAGQKVAEIYSPELLSAQQEFLALRRAENLREGDALIEAARRRLQLLGMAEHEIEAIERNGQATSRVGVYSPADGFVVDLSTREGGQIQSGATLMFIADLSSVWLIANVPERDASRIQPGDSVEARLESAPGETFTGKVDFIYPKLDNETRTARVRILVPNKEHLLRPGMFAKVTLRASAHEALSVPSESVIYTGTRSVVIVKQDTGFRPAEVQTGAESAGRTEILSGLQEGEQVVASGQFLIDSEASLSGVLARLSQHEEPASTDPHAGHTMNAEPPPEFEEAHSHDHSEAVETP